MKNSSPRATRVWDLPVRVGHWLLVVAFAVAYLSEGEPRVVHTVAGYVVAAYVLGRVLWGFVGTAHARFASFVASPAAAFRYLAALLRRRAPRYLGHSPAGGVMVLLLLASLVATTVTGLMLYAVHDAAGPLAGLVADPAPAVVAPQGENESPRAEFWEELHELCANLTLTLVILHVAGVAVASWAHRENLPRAMVTGEKRLED